MEIDQRGEIRICASEMAESDFDFAFTGERPRYHSRHGLNGGVELNDFQFRRFRFQDWGLRLGLGLGGGDGNDLSGIIRVGCLVG